MGLSYRIQDELVSRGKHLPALTSNRTVRVLLLTHLTQVLVSSNFDGFWVEVSERFNLPASCTTRYVTDRNLLEYDVPTDDEADESVEDKIHNDTAAAEKSSPTSVPHTPGLVTDHESRSSTPDSSDESSRESTPDTWPQLSEAALTRPTPVILRCTKCGRKFITSMHSSRS